MAKTGSASQKKSGGGGASLGKSLPSNRPDKERPNAGGDERRAAAQTAPAQSPGYSAFSIKGLTSNDPANVERNRQAAAGYAIESYQREGTAIPSHLRPYVDARIAAQGSGGSTGGGTGSFGLPDPASGRITSVAGLDVSGVGRAAGSLFQSVTGFSSFNDMFDGGGRGAAGTRATPTPGPGVVAGLGRPGAQGGGGGDGGQGLLSAPSVVTATPPSDSVDSGNIPADPGDGLSGEEVSRRNAERSRVPTYEAGGMVGPGGVPIRPSTTSLDLPPALARMLAPGGPSFAEGGMVGPGGMPMRPSTSPMAMNVAQQGGAPVVGMAQPGQTGRPLNFAAIDQQAQQFMEQNPQQVEQIRAEVQAAMASGELDQSSLNTFVQVATVALQNPEMWPQLRQVLIRQGMLDAEEVSEEYDQGFLIVLYIIGKTMAAPSAPPPAPMSQGQAPQMSMESGGPLPPKSKNPDGSIPINAHEGEYVIPADVTRKLGTDHFDKLIAKARGANGNGSSTSEGES